MIIAIKRLNVLFPIFIAQINPTVGDISGNARKIMDARAESSGADLVVFPEMSVTGYPPEDLIFRKNFVHEAQKAVEEIAAASADGGPWLIIGAPLEKGEKIYNAAFLIGDGKIQAIQRKYDLPNYGVFDEKRVFSPGPPPELINYKNTRLGLLICEDMWNAVAVNSMKGADLLIAINASPFEMGKHERRLSQARQAVKIAGAPLVYVNQVGGQDDLVFDGGSFALSAAGEITAQLPFFREYAGKMPNAAMSSASNEEMIYKAIMLGLKDYARKNGFSQVILGMSGGIDSALAAALAADALGPENVRLVMMPSRFTSKESVRDAEDCAERLKIPLETIPVEDMVMAFEDTLAPIFSGRPWDITEENIQSRVRGTVLMALSNKFGGLVLATGNKSEMATGYATLYGDMCGGYAPLKDVYKTQVYQLARWRNAQPGGAVITRNILDKAPTAELRPNQKDQDNLPPYDVLDAVLYQAVEQAKSPEDIIAMGYGEETVRKIFSMICGAEYKRRQSSPGPKVSALAFTRDRRYPITSAFKG